MGRRTTAGLPSHVPLQTPPAWSLVLMTSSGQVTMPLTKPPMAPARALNCEFDASTA